MLAAGEHFAYHSPYVGISRRRFLRARLKKNERDHKKRDHKTGRYCFADHPRPPYSVLQIKDSNAPAHLHRSESVFHQHSNSEGAYAAGHWRKAPCDFCGFARVYIAYERVTVLCECCAPLLVITEQALKITSFCDPVCAHVYDHSAGLDIRTIDHRHTPYRRNQYVCFARYQSEVRRARVTDGNGRVA